MGAQTLTTPRPATAFAASEHAEARSDIFRYQAQLPSEYLDLGLIDALAEALEDVPDALQLRVVMEIAGSTDLTCWMLVDGISALERKVLLASFTQVGVRLESSECPKFTLNSDSHAVVRVREGGSVTRPGMTRTLTRWLLQRGHVAYLVFDYKHTATAGLARYDLAFVLRDQTHITEPFSAEVANVLHTNTAMYRRHRAKGYLERICSWTLQRPRLDACIGNIADLFPL